MYNRLKIFIMNTGCSRRYLDTSRLTKYFQINNCTIVTNPKNADYILFGACAYKNSAIEESFRIINTLQKHHGKLLVIGCLPAVRPKEFGQNVRSDYVLAKDLNNIDAFFPNFKIKFSEVPDANTYRTISFFYLRLFMQYGLSKYLSGEYPFKDIKNKIDSIWNWSNIGRFINVDKGTCYLRISDGCLGNCSYCAIRNAIGKLRSKPLKTCLKEYRQLLDKGYRHFIFVADDTGAYGLDNNSNLINLLNEFSTLDRRLNVKWHFEDLHPRWATKYRQPIVEFIRCGKIAKIVCPVQSGSPRILGLMNRQDNIEETADTLIRFKHIDKSFKMDTQLIIGFPTETDHDLLMTLEFVKKVHFDFVYLFKYCDNPTTNSFHLAEKINGDTINRRIKHATSFLEKEKIRFGCTEF